MWTKFAGRLTLLDLIKACRGLIFVAGVGSWDIGIKGEGGSMFKFARVGNRNEGEVGVVTFDNWAWGYKALTLEE